MLVHNHTQNPIGFSVALGEGKLQYFTVQPRQTENIDNDVWEQAKKLDIIRCWLDNGFLSDAKVESAVKKETKKKIKPKKENAKIPDGITVEQETVVAAQEQSDD